MAEERGDSDLMLEAAADDPVAGEGRAEDLQGDATAIPLPDREVHESGRALPQQRIEPVRADVVARGQIRGIGLVAMRLGDIGARDLGSAV